MIQPLNMPQLSSAKPRGGLQSISELLPKLIAQYELQAQARQQIEADNRRRAARKQSTPFAPAVPASSTTSQTTFAWYQ